MKSTRSSARSRVSRKRPEPVSITDPLRALVRGLTRARGFALFFAVCNQPVERDRLIAMLGEALPETDMPRVILDKHTADILAEIRAQAPGSSGPVMIIGLESAVSTGMDHHDILTVLNLQRPRWKDELSVPVVFWVPEYVLGFLEREAPDFYDWRSDTIAFPDIESGEIDTIRQFSWSPTVETNLSIDQRNARIQELKERLEKTSYLDPTVQILRAQWLNALSEQLVITGSVDEALVHYQEAALIFKKHGYKQGHAVVMCNIARILFDKGEIDSALEIFNKNLVDFEKLGDKHNYGIILGEIARIYVIKGDINEAFRLYTEALKFFDDKRGHAITLVNIAGVLRAQGNIEKANKALKNASLIFEEIGDKRSYAIALENIARIQYNNGNFNDALNFYNKSLEIYRRIGDSAGIAHCLWPLGQIKTQFGMYHDALDLFSQSMEINSRLGNLQGISVVGLDYGRLLLETGASGQGIAVLERSRDGFIKLGRKNLADEAQKLIDAHSHSEPSSPKNKTADP